MNEDRVLLGHGPQQSEDELFEALLNLGPSHTYNDVWQNEPSHIHAHPQETTLSTAQAFNAPHVQSEAKENASSELSSRTSLDFWEPQPFCQPTSFSEHGPQPRRGLPRKRSRYFTSQGQRTSTAVAIPIASASQSYATRNTMNQMDPLQRWRDSPPEHEPATISAISRALGDSPVHRSGYNATWSPTAQPRSTSAPTTSNPFRTYRQASSRASSESGVSESSQKSTKSTQSRNRARLQTRRAAKAKDDKEKRRFKCTFCCDDFRTKYDWVRHEKSLHLDVEEWRCSPHGSMVLSQITGRIHCAYCNALDPSMAHLETHNYEICDNPERPTIFHRKDHLVQHLRLAHHLESMPLIDDWKTNTVALTCRCGFCDLRLSSWDERTSHLSEHFRQGLTMTDWRGDHDFDASIRAKIRNSIPPYVIGYESRALVPFKADSSGTQDHFNQISSYIESFNLEQPNTQPEDGNAALRSLPANNISRDPNPLPSDPGGYLSILTRHLGRFAREQMMRGIVPTDEMFQNEARNVVYDRDADGWDTTIADNEYWLNSFKAQFDAGG